MKLARSIVALLLLAGCDGDGPGDDDAGLDAGDTMDAGEDAGPPFDAGDDFRDFLAALDGSVWNGLADRDGVTRGFEMQFVGGGSPMWGEIRNPYGPSRQRIRRFLRPNATGCSSPTVCSVTTTVSIPDTTWETPQELRGRSETWTIEIIDGFPRALEITNESTGVLEAFNEGAFPVPDSGLTAEVRTYDGSGPIATAFCTSGTDLMRDVVWAFARGESAEPTLAYDVVAGANLSTWVDVDNNFGIRDVQGFDVNTLGGSERTDQFFFTVRYTGVVLHPGGDFQMMESDTFDATINDDDFEDLIDTFIDFGFGSSLESDVFFEVHGFTFPADLTGDEPLTTLPAGDVPIEIIIVRCMMPFGDRDLGVSLRLDTGEYEFLGDQPTLPYVDDIFFPPVL